MLEYARDDAEVIEVGKAPGRQCPGQPEINWILVDRARRRGRVVRLKGGDPGVFARLAEEIEAVRGAGVGFEIVPGVSAAMAAAARRVFATERRPPPRRVRHRLRSARHAAGVDWALLARTEGTLVSWRSARWGSITSTLMVLGLGLRGSPALIVERRGFTDEQTVAGRLGDIAERAHRAGVRSPALLLIGPTVAAASAPITVRPP